MSDETDANPSSAPPGRGFLHSLSSVLMTVLEMGYTRLELVLIDLQEGAESLFKMLVWSLVALFAGCAGLFIGALAIIFVFWDTHRVLASVLVMVGFLLIALIALLVVMAKVRERHNLFSTSLHEFQKDREMFKARL